MVEVVVVRQLMMYLLDPQEALMVMLVVLVEVAVLVMVAIQIHLLGLD
jgi:hypothetical protein